MTVLPELVDSHCHLDSPQFNGETDDVVKRATDVGVTRMMTIGTRFSAFDNVIAMTQRYPSVYAAIGVHPEYADEEAPFLDTDVLCEKAKSPKVVAIGEIGLDYHFRTDNKETQKAVFRAQLQAAKKANLPVSIHTRDADDDMADILTSESDNGALRGVIHCFSSGTGLAETALSLGFYLSATGIITFKKSDTLCAIFKEVPMDRLLVETDCPFLAPTPFRGKVNEPSYVVKTAERLAEIKGVSYAEMAGVTTRNFLTLFSKAK